MIDSNDSKTLDQFIKFTVSISKSEQPIIEVYEIVVHRFLTGSADPKMQFEAEVHDVKHLIDNEDARVNVKQLAMGQMLAIVALPWLIWNLVFCVFFFKTNAWIDNQIGCFIDENSNLPFDEPGDMEDYVDGH